MSDATFPESRWVYERAFTEGGSTRVLAVDRRYLEAKGKLIAICRTEAQVQAAIRRHEVRGELVRMREREPDGRRFWRLATALLRKEPSIAPAARYGMKRAALGTRLRDVVDPRQLPLCYQK